MITILCKLTRIPSYDTIRTYRDTRYRQWSTMHTCVITTIFISHGCPITFSSYQDGLGWPPRFLGFTSMLALIGGPALEAFHHGLGFTHFCFLVRYQFYFGSYFLFEDISRVEKLLGQDRRCRPSCLHNGWRYARGFLE